MNIVETDEGYEDFDISLLISKEEKDKVLLQLLDSIRRDQLSKNSGSKIRVEQDAVDFKNGQTQILYLYEYNSRITTGVDQRREIGSLEFVEYATNRNMLHLRGVLDASILPATRLELNGINERSEFSELIEALDGQGIDDEYILALAAEILERDSQPLAVLNGQTDSSVVIQAERPGRKSFIPTYPGYGHSCFIKIGKPELIQREANYIRSAWEHDLLKPITVHMSGHYSGNFGMLITTDMRDTLIPAPKNKGAYLKLRQQAFKRFSRTSGRNLISLSFDPAVIDAFNIALEHSIVTPQSNPELSGRMIDDVAGWDKVDSWLREAPNELSDIVIALASNSAEFKAVWADVIAYASEGKIVGNLDRREDNIFSKDLFRIVGDTGYVQKTMPELVIANTEHQDVEGFCNAYNAFIEFLVEQEIGSEPVYADPRMARNASFLVKVSNAAYLAVKEKKKKVLA